MVAVPSQATHTLRWAAERPRLERLVRWQAKEREMEADLAAGRHGPVFSSGAEFLAALREIAGLGPSSDSHHAHDLTRTCPVMET